MVGPCGSWKRMEWCTSCGELRLNVLGGNLADRVRRQGYVGNLLILSIWQLKRRYASRLNRIQTWKASRNHATLVADGGDLS